MLFDDFDLVLRNTPFKSISPNLDREILVHWWMNVYCPVGYGDLKTEHEIFQKWNTALYRNFKYTNISGYCIESGQSCLKLACHKNEPVEPQVEELQLWLPDIKPTTDKNGRGDKKAKYISIFEHTLSAGACYSLSVYDEKNITLDTLRFGRFTVECKFDNITDAVAYVKNHHWYLQDDEDEE